MIRAVRLLAIYVCRCMVYMITCRFHGFCIAANESMSEWKPSSPSMAAASNGMPSAAVIAGSPQGISSPTAGTGSGCILDSISRTSCSTVCRSILGAAAASGVSGQFIIHIVGHGVDQELCLAPTLLVQDRGYLLVAWVTGIELDGKSEGILLFAHMDHLLVFVAAYKRPYPAALAPISSTKMAVPTLPDFSICFRSSREPPPTKITLPVRSSIFRSRRVRKRSATKDSAPRSTSVWISLPYSVLQPVRMESMSVSSSSKS